MDKDTRDILMRLTAEMSRLSTLVETNVKGDEETRELINGHESRIRKVEKWLYGLPVAYVLTLGTVFTTVARMGGKA